MLSTGQQCVVGIEALADAGATRVGAAIPEERLTRLLRAAAVTALTDRALNSMARGRRTRRELELRLRRYEPDPQLIAEALDRLEASGLLSDADVARAEAESRLRRGEAPGRVRQTLRRKGIDARGAEQALSQAVEADGFDEVEACRRQAERRQRALASLEPAVAHRRLMAFLLRRGFSGAVVRRVLDTMKRG